MEIAFQLGISRRHHAKMSVTMRIAGRSGIDVGAARDVFLENVVLHRAGKPREIRALLLGHRDVESQQDRGGRVDGHRSGDAFERNAVEQRLHVFERVNGHADFADLALRERVVGVHADLRGQIEGDGKSRLSLFEQIAIAAVGFGGAAEAGVLPHGPEPAAIHGGIDAASERELAGIAEVAFRVPAAQIIRSDDGFHRQPVVEAAFFSASCEFLLAASGIEAGECAGMMLHRIALGAAERAESESGHHHAHRALRNPPARKWDDDAMSSRPEAARKRRKGRRKRPWLHERPAARRATTRAG